MKLWEIITIHRSIIINHGLWPFSIAYISKRVLTERTNAWVFHGDLYDQGDQLATVLLMHIQHENFVRLTILDRWALLPSGKRYQKNGTSP